LRRTAIFIFFVTATAFAQPHPLTFEDLLSFQRIGAPRLAGLVFSTPLLKPLALTERSQ